MDEALAGGHASHPDAGSRELQELALMLTAEAPEADREFTERLRVRMDAGFPAPEGSARARADGLRRLRPSRDKLLPALAFASMLVVAVGGVAGLASLGSGSGDDDSGSGGAGVLSSDSGSAQEASPRAGADAGAAADAEPDVASSQSQLSRAAPSPSAGDFRPGQAQRRIERSAALELAAPVDEMERVADRVTVVVDRYGGFVLNSAVSTGEDSAGGDFDLRIPADRLRPALRDLAELATVRSQSQSGRDVTRQTVTARDRLDAARAERASLLRRLEEADTDEEAEALRVRLDIVAGEIQGLRSQLRGLRLSTDYAKVVVTLLAADGDTDAGGGGIGDAFRDAEDLLVGAAGVLIRVMALALPLGLLAAGTWWAGATARRRRRESALA